MPRTLIVWYPDWPAVAAGCRAEEPAVVVFANRVVAATPAAREDGIVLGLRRREAQARCPEVRVIAADGGRDARSWEPAVAALETLTPGIEILAPGEVALATRGPSRYFGGDEALADLVARTVDSAVGVAGCNRVGCRVGVADGRFAARLAARAAGRTGGERVVVVERGRSRQWLAPQPVSALGEGYEELAGLLVRLGVRTLGDFARLPAPAVLGRFGTSGETAHKIARGLDPRPVAARTPPPETAVCAEFDPPEDRIEAAAFVAKSLADQLLDRLEQQGLAATMVSIEAQTEHAEHLVRHWRHEGALSAAALAERTRWQLEGWFAGTNTGTGAGDQGRPSAGLTLLRLVPEEVHPDTGRQLGFWGGSAESDARAARAFARIQGLLGPDSVVTAVRAGGRGWAEQVRLVPWGDSRAEGGDSRRPGAREGRAQGRGTRQAGVPNGRARGRAPGRADVPESPVRESPVRESPPWPGRLDRPAPAVVYTEEIGAEMLDAAGNPVEVNGRGLLSSPPASVSIAGAAAKEVTAWAGPWPIEERWWDRGGRRRARIQVLMDGGEAHLLSRERGRWWVEASYF
jgi:protein ImuB